MLPASIAPSAAPAPDHRVQLVDEGDDLAVALLDLVQDGLQPLLELAPVLGAGHHRAQVERDDALAAQRLGHVAGHDPLGQALDDRRLADARLADEHRVVLGPAGQHLDDPADLGVPADDRVELALAGAVGQVDAVLLQGLIGALGVGRGDPGVPAHLLERVGQRLRGGSGLAQQRGRRAAVGGQADQQVLGRDVLVGHLPGALARGGDGGQQRPGRLRGADGGAGRLGQPGELLLDLGQDGGRVGADGAQQRGGGAAFLPDQRGQQVQPVHIRVAAGRGPLHRLAQSLLALAGQLVIHGYLLLSRHVLNRDQDAAAAVAQQAGQPRRHRARRLQLGAQLGDLRVQLGQPQPALLLRALQLQDPLDPGQVDALLLGEALDLPQDQDVPQRVPAAAAAGPAGGDEAEPVVGTQRLRVQPG